ncbi:MAG TPA: hypothetical protein VF039_02525 [Longimicrobiales bacterium]
MPDPILIETDSERPLQLEAGNQQRIVILGDSAADIVIGDDNRGTIEIHGSNLARIVIGANNRGNVIIHGSNDSTITIGDGNRGHVRVDGDNHGTIAGGKHFGDVAEGGAWAVVSVGGDNEGLIRIGGASAAAVIVEDVNERSITIGDGSRVLVRTGDDNEGEIRVGNDCRGSVMIFDANEGTVVIGHSSRVGVDMKSDNEGSVFVGDGSTGYVRVGDANQNSIRVGAGNQASVVVAQDNDGELIVGDRNTGSIGVHGDNEGSIAVGDQNSGPVVVRDANEGRITTGSRNQGLVHVVGDNEGNISLGQGSTSGVLIEDDNDGSVDANGSTGPITIEGETGQVGAGTPVQDGSRIREQVQELIGWIKAEAARRTTSEPMTIDVNSNWYQRLLVENYLADYLAAPGPEAGARAVRLLGLQWDGMAQFNQLVVPSLLGQVLEGLPAELGAATGVIHPDVQALCPNIDGGFLLGSARVAGTANDPLVGGRNWSQMMHWATGVKYHHVNADTMHVLFLGYEIWHMEGWEAFGEDAINDLIAEEQGRLLGRMLALGEINAGNMAQRILASAVAARAWVGSLLAHRQGELDAFVAATTQPTASPWLAEGVFGLQPGEDGYWGSTTLFQELANGKTVDQLKTSDFVQKLIAIYRLIEEASRYQAANGAFHKPPLLVDLLNHRYDDLLSELALPGFPGPGFIPDAASAVAGAAGN